MSLVIVVGAMACLVIVGGAGFWLMGRRKPHNVRAFLLVALLTPLVILILLMRGDPAATAFVVVGYLVSLIPILIGVAIRVGR